MKNVGLAACFLALAGAPIASFADLQGEIPRAMTVRCTYNDGKTSRFEHVVVATANQGGEAASTKTFQRNGQSESISFLVNPGEVAECVFPSGNRVRAKVGEGISSAYGRCGADAQVFASVWVNKRKIASRVWFAGHCIEESDNTDVSFSMIGNPKMSAARCQTVRSSEPEALGDDSKAAPKAPLSVCVDFPDIARFPVDELEYPPAGAKILAAGDIEQLAGSHAVCDPALKELKGDFSALSYPVPGKSTLPRPNWEDSSADLPQELTGSREAVFDFDNDGKLDRVLSRDFESSYMQGTKLLVERGESSSSLVSPGPMGKLAWFIPCQMDTRPHGIRDCAPFSQKADEAGFWMEARGKKNFAYFRARYTVLSPFFFNGETFVGVGSNSFDTAHLVAVVKPMPEKTFQPVCLFRQVPENF
jgi:hypothetical protein